MTIDKSWIHIQNRLEPAFRTGLEAFIERCKNYLNDQGRCHCPCRKCGNRRYQTPQMIDGHIERFGFEPSYMIWTHHGEVRPPRVVPATTTGVEDFLHDIAVDTNDDPDDDDVTETPSATKDDTDNLFDYAKTELYPGCTWENSLDFLAKMLNMKVLYKWTDHSFDKLLEYLKFCMPKDNTVPSSHYEAKKVLKKIGLGYESIHACKNDCCLFWKENKKLEVCPICGESRWKDTKTTGKKVANKILRYFPLTPRLKRLYRSRHTAKYMTWHATGQCSEPGKMRHPVDGSSWKDFDRRYPEFAGEARNVRLGLSADGFNPYGNMSLSYSMWPVIVTTYNMPPWLCMKQTSLMLTLLIPGPKSPGKDIDVYLRPLVDELKTLWSEGVRTLDVVTDTYFTMKAMLLWTINDFPARSSLSGWSGQGYKACPTCNEDTPSTRVIGKTAFVGHRRFLETNHHWRSNKSFNNKNDRTKPPRQFNHEVVSSQLAQLPTSIPGKHPSNAGVKRKRGEHNWTKISIFRELEYWKYISLQHNLDVMHIEKNVCESLLGTLLMNDKSKDTHNARVDLKNLGIRKELWLIQNNRRETRHLTPRPNRDARYLKPHPKYSFTNENRQKFCRFIKEVKLPDGFGSSFKRKVTDNYNNIMGMKSHDCHIMMQRLLPVGVRGCLDDNISRPIIELCAFFKQICARELMVDDMLNAQDQLIKLLCNLELIFPPAFFDIMVHLVMHLPQEAIQGGPVYMRWMYPFEREMKKLKNYVRNKARPEGCIAEGYVADEALTICSLYLKDVETRFNRPDRNEDVPIIPCSIHVFQSHCRLISKGLNTTLTQELRMNLHWYVLNNCSDIDVYKNEFTTENPEKDLKTDFPSWFQHKIRCLRLNPTSECSDELLSLATGPLIVANSYTACIVNGVRFVVHSRDCRRTTQNSGVSTPGDEGSTYYGQLEDILELNYKFAFKVVLFKCKWFKTDNTGRTIRSITKNNITSICTSQEWFKNEQHILATQAKQIFYLEDPSRTQHWKVIQEVNHRKIWGRDIIVDDEVDVIHGTSSSETTLDVTLDNLSYTSLSINGEFTSVVEFVPSRSSDVDFIDDNELEDVDDIDDSDSEDVETGDEREPQMPDDTYSSDESD